MTKGHSYVASLLDRLKTLEQTSPYSAVEESGSALGGYFAYARGTFRYLGANACLTLRGAKLQQRGPGLVPQLDISCPSLPFSPWAPIDQDWHQYLLSLFFENLHGPYPIVDRGLSCFGDAPSPTDELSLTESLLLSLVYAAACHCLSNNDNRLLLLSRSLRSAALAKSGRIFVELSIEVLRAVLLLCLNSLFDPADGNMGQQITLAYRISVELGAGADEQTKRELQRLLRPLYSLGNQFARTLDRPSGVLDQVRQIGLFKTY